MTKTSDDSDSCNKQACLSWLLVYVKGLLRRETDHIASSVLVSRKRKTKQKQKWTRTRTSYELRVQLYQVTSGGRDEFYCHTGRGEGEKTCILMTAVGIKIVPSCLHKQYFVWVCVKQDPWGRTHAVCQWLYRREREEAAWQFDQGIHLFCQKWTFVGKWEIGEKKQMDKCFTRVYLMVYALGYQLTWLE